MATLELVPSGYTGSTSISASSSYPISNGYADTSNTSYARLSLSTSTTGYLYYTFDCSSIPSTATISSITGSVKARVSNTTRVTSTLCQLFTGTTAKGSNVTFASTSTSNIVTLSAGSSWTRAELDDLRLKIGGTGSSSSQSKYIYFYGAEITVTYTVGSPRTITTTLSGNGTISPSGSTTLYDGDEFTLTITPATKTDTVTATYNGTDITSSLVAHGVGGTVSNVLGTYTLVSGGFNSGESYFEGLVGNGHDATQTTSNYYSSGSGIIAVFTYDMAFTDIPSNAVIERVYCLVNGHAESTSNSSEYMCAMLISGSTELTEELNFKSVGTSNSTQTLECETLPTVSQLASLKLQCRLGYYGGAINGATCYVVYSVQSSNPEYYTYTYTVSGNATIAVVISSGGGSTDKLYVKINGTWKEVATAYKKVNGSWVQTAITSLFESGVNYKVGT